jgi:hypothetical protein
MKKYLYEIKSEFLTTVTKLTPGTVEEAWSAMLQEQARDKNRRLKTKIFVFESDLHASGVCKNKNGFCPGCLLEHHTIVLETRSYRKSQGNAPSGKIRKDLAIR